MKNRLIKLMIAALLLLVLPAGLLLRGAAMPSLYGQTYYAQLPRLYQRLTSAQGKKIIVIGGSNVAFGLDGGLLEQLLAQKGYSYTVCPFGLYGAVGTSAMLELSRDSLAEGDVVVLAVEPVSEAMSTYFGADSFWKCAEDAPELILGLSQEKLAALVGNYIPYYQQRMAILSSGALPAAQGVYGSASFNERCDMVYERAGNTMPVGYDTTTPVNLDTVEISADFVRQVSEYCRLASQRGASVVMSFSPVNRSALTVTSEEGIAGFFERCNQSLPCPLISDPNRYILDSGWVYDSNFHLNSPGARLRTCRLAEDLLLFLGCHEELEYAVEEMPASLALEPEETEDPGYFEFVSTANGLGYLLYGLTEEGLRQELLQVPAWHEGRPVIGFTEDALRGAAQLVRLEVPESVEALPARLFRDCPKLTQLMLAHTGSTCAITEETFLGVDQLRIYVPEAAYPMYRDGYGCDANPWTPYLDRILTY